MVKNRLGRMLILVCLLGFMAGCRTGVAVKEETIEELRLIREEKTIPAPPVVKERVSTPEPPEAPPIPFAIEPFPAPKPKAPPAVEEPEKPPVPTFVKRVVETHYNRGLKHYQNNEFSKAIASFKKVLYMTPEHKEAREYLEKAREGLKRQKK